MKLRVSLFVSLAALHCAVAAPFSTNANRLTYLDSDDPFYVGRDFPKLVTPQWVGEAGVEAVVVLSIDDMRETPKYETMLRPILERLKKIDGRAHVSIMVNTIAPTNAQLQLWLAEGMSLECHTIAHPCPLCQKSDFTAAAKTYHDCVDLLNQIPGSRPVAFRMPCCDSMNSPTPRFYSEIFNRVSEKGRFLTIDSSVMVLLTTNDTSLPRELVMEPNGRERFRKYLPTETNALTRVSMGSFTTTIDDYPYPYVIGKTCWEFPCIAPSDWEANNLHAPNNPRTIEDWERALDAIVLKQGVMTFIFHPHGWIQATQMVQFIDYAVSKYGKRVKFLNFREAHERLQRNLFVGQSLRRSDDGGDNGVRLLDVNNDGFLDVVLGFQDRHVTRIWDSGRRNWKETEFPLALIDSDAAGKRFDTGVHFGAVHEGGNAAMVVASEIGTSAWHFDGERWIQGNVLAELLKSGGIFTARSGLDQGVRFRDIDRDGSCELLVCNAQRQTVYKWNGRDRTWKDMSLKFPAEVAVVDKQGRDAGLRFMDVDADGYDDLIFSNHERYSLHLFRPDDRKLRLKPGWTDEIISGKRENPLTDPIPPIVRDGPNRNNGVWFARSTMWIQNEDTAHLPDRVDRRTFKQLLSGSGPRALAPEESLRAMRVRPGFKVELVASEPLVQSPVAFEWAADGRLWVVEMGDYPLGIDGKGKGGGRVRVLEDRDGDGHYDNATTFLDGLSFPNGIYPWRDGVVISAAPDIFYAGDTNGDGKADVHEVLFTGFNPGNQQHRANGFDYGFDGWLYGANGDSGGNVRPAGDLPNQGMNLRGHDFRVQPDWRMIHTIEGQTQFGRHRDDFGNWFGNNNPNWLWHYFFPEHYLARNPLLPLKTTKKMLANYNESTRCFPISRTLSRFNDPFAANHVTSGNSPTPYRDELFGKDFVSSVFISEPVHNLVHREVLEPDGVTFTSHRASDETTNEFLASSDNWFRPTMLKTGPDGALYIADMYRLVIEHPEWIPAEMQKRLDLRAGADKGRIYRVYPEGATLRRIPSLAKLNLSELTAAMDSPNGWQRDTVQRLMLERGASAGTLFTVAKESKFPQARVQALWTLQRLRGVATALPFALRDGDARVREHAILLSEAISQFEEFSLVNDPSPRVRCQLAFSLGNLNDPRAAEALVKLAGDEDENIRNAALSSAPAHAKAMLPLMTKLPANNRARAYLPMVQKLANSNPAALASPMFVIERTNVISAEHRAERAKVVARYSDVRTLRGNSTNGAALFKQNCAQCHRLRGEGTEIGPDLGMMIGKPIEQIVEAILNPNAALEERYRSYSLTMRDGRELTGIIAAETPTTITLRAANQPEQTILRGELKQMTTSGWSLMPEGLESAFAPQQLADLIAFVLGR
jgi:putative membrane-bound dehydrogenase-like protein